MHGSLATFLIKTSTRHGPVASTAGPAPRMDARRVNGSNRSILITSIQKQPALERDMNRLTIRNARKSDLPAINQLIFQLISTLDKKEDIDPEFVSRNSRSLFRSAGLAQTLLSLMPVMIIPVVWVLYRQRTSWRGILGAFTAVIGVAILFLV